MHLRLFSFSTCQVLLCLCPFAMTIHGQQTGGNIGRANDLMKANTMLRHGTHQPITKARQTASIGLPKATRNLCLWYHIRLLLNRSLSLRRCILEPMGRHSATGPSPVRLIQEPIQPPARPQPARRMTARFRQLLRHQARFSR